MKKYRFCDPKLTVVPEPDLGIIVVIPCFKEENLLRSLKSLYDCDLPNCSIEVITVINASETALKEDLLVNEQTLAAAENWTNNIEQHRIKFHFLVDNQLLKKHAGVGLARKIGMDEAVWRFHQLNKDGVIVCFDADAQCEKNYLKVIEKHFRENPKTPGCSIHFEHPLSGNEYTEEVYEGITEYELFLRYYRQGLKYVGLPYAYHTIGSSMVVRSSVYQKQGGMNRRKAGEDFYFLQKIIELGNFTEISDTKVIPSPRPSDRVPFGTGRAIGQYLENKNEYLTYNYQTFCDLKLFNGLLYLLYESKTDDFMERIPESLRSFVEKEDLNAVVNEIHRNANSETVFYKRLYKWFDAFKVLKFVHYARDHFYENVPVADAALKLLELNKKEFANNKEILHFYRTIDRKLR